MSQNLSKKLMSRMFRRVEGVVLDLSTQQIGLQNQDGIYTLTKNTAPEAATTRARRAEAAAGEQPAVTYGVTLNPISSFGITVPAFAQITPLDKIEEGDLVLGDTRALGWVIQRNGASLRLLDQNGMTKQYTPPKVAMVGIDGALVVKSLTSLFGNNGATGFTNALLPLMLANDGDESSLSEILPFMLLSQQQAGDNANAMSQMLPLILMLKGNKGGGNKDGLLMAMMMGGMGGGAGGMNPMMLAMMMGGDSLGGFGDTFAAEGMPALPQARSTRPDLTRVR